MRGGDMRPRQAQLRVHVIENFKNLLLVMVSGNVFVKSAERSGMPGACFIIYLFFRVGF